MWLVVELFEILFILIGMNWNKMGIGVGLATIFRPYAFLYTALIDKKQWKYVMVICCAFILLMAYLGVLGFYVHRMYEYGAKENMYRDGLDYMALLLWGMLLYASWNNKPMRNFGLIASVPFIIRTFGHYFLPSFAFFLMGYLNTESIS